MYNLCIIKPNKDAYSETFIAQHILHLSGNKTVLYGGNFPLFKQDGTWLIESKLARLQYLIQKRILKHQEITVRTHSLVNYLQKQSIDVVLAEYGMVGAMVSDACRLAKVPLVIHFHGADAHHRPTIEAYNYPKAFSYASAIVGVSKDMVEQLAKIGAPTEKLFLNPYGIDTKQFSALNISNSSAHFLAIGRFVEKKSPSSLIKAFQLVIKKIPQARLWMVGNGSLLQQSQQLAKQLGLANQITFTGVLSSEQIVQLMKGMRCFVQHSVTAADGDMEGTPLAILEASARGLPIVSTFHAGIKQAVIDGQTGFLVDEYNIEEMAKRMIDIGSSSDLATQMGINGRAHILENYQINKQMAKLDQIIQRCL